MGIEKYRPALEAELGTIVSESEHCPDVYCIEASREGRFRKEYYVVLDSAPFAAQVQDYGRRLDGLRLYATDEPDSGCRVVQYEVSKYNILHKRKRIPEELFQDLSLHAMEVHPEYFGTFPVPYHTPEGYTLRWRTLANGICWLETSRAKELLAVCFPVWNAELSSAALSLSKVMELDRIAGVKKAMGYVFFPKDISCVPIYELMETRQEWDGTVIHLPALMNALWERAPGYVLQRNGRRPDIAALQSDGKHVIAMYPDAGTDFLLLK